MTEAPHRPADSIAIGGSNSKDDAVLLCYNRLPKRKFSYEELEECKCAAGMMIHAKKRKTTWVS